MFFKQWIERTENVLMNERMWIAAVVIILAAPVLVVVLQWAEARWGLAALCRGLLSGGR